MQKHIFILAFFLSFALQAEPMIYPAKGQSAEQQSKDKAECHTWAIENSGYDPANPPVSAASPQPAGPSGARLRGATRGAIIGEIAGGDTGDAALAGAVMGASRDRRERRMQDQQAQAQVQQVQEDGLSAYNRASQACLEGRGYTVK